MSFLHFKNIVTFYKKLIGSITITAIIISLLYAFLSPPYYRAELIMTPAETEKNSLPGGLSGQLGGIAGIAGITANGSEKTDSSMATLSSRSFIVDFINENEIMPILFSEKWDSNINSWSDEEEIPSQWDGYRKFKKLMNVSLNKETNILTLSLEWKDPFLAAEWTNKLFYKINLVIKNLEKEESKKSITFLQEELSKTKIVSLEASIHSLIQKQLSTLMLANTREDYVFSLIDPAVAPDKKSRPVRSLILIFGTILGFLLGLFVALYKDFVNEE